MDDAGAEDAKRLEREVRRLLDRTSEALENAGAKDEALGVLKGPRGFSVFKTAQVIQPVGRAWRLGVLLLDRSGTLYSTGEVTRAIEPGRAATNRSPAGELRREIRRAAARGKFVEGEVVNFGFTPVAVDIEALRAGSGLLAIEGGVVMVRWDAGGSAPLDTYLPDRASLLIGE